MSNAPRIQSDRPARELICQVHAHVSERKPDCGSSLLPTSCDGLSTGTSQAVAPTCTHFQPELAPHALWRDNAHGLAPAPLHERGAMKTTTWLCAGVMALGFAAIQTVVQGQAGGRQGATDTIPLDSDDIAGVVTGPKGPEAGVWVIAETTGLPTKFARIVVTDDRGRYLIPDLPSATYSVWVRGYGLVDSEKVQATPGKSVNLTAVVAPDAAQGRAVLSVRLLVLSDQGPGQERVPRDGPVGQRDRAGDQEPGPMAADAQVRHVLGLPRAGHASHARDSIGLPRHVHSGCVAAPHSPPARRVRT